MEPVGWKESYSVGVAVLDRQHRKIFEIINLLKEHPTAAVDSILVSEILTSLTEYAMEHFATEEQLLRDHGYPDYETHVKGHGSYREVVAQICQDAMEKKVSVPGALLEYLVTWWTKHILEDDMEYRSFFAQKGLK